jgi:hypothetical protein
LGYDRCRLLTCHRYCRRHLCFVSLAISIAGGAQSISPPLAEFRTQFDHVTEIGGQFVRSPTGGASLQRNRMQETASASRWPRGRHAPFLGAALAVLAFQFMLGLYAVALNTLFYSKYGPFFDSMSYDNTLANMQIDARSEGTLAALSNAIYSSTVVYPWLLFAPFLRFVAASRAVGVWIQIFAAACMQLVLVFYFIKVRSRAWAESLAFSCAFLLTPAVFDFNGGIADFRMDLLQYLLFVTVVATYLIARERRSRAWWALLGLAAGLLCLGRATSPVYIVPICIVCAAVDVIVDGQNRWKVLFNWLLAVAVAMLVAGWFFIKNFNFLYYYYVISSSDANAHLPLAESVAHIRFAVHHIGVPMLVVLVAVAVYSLARSRRHSTSLSRRLLNWRPLLFSAVPLGYLVLSGAGLNPFVSIVSMGGIIFFLLDPIDAPQQPSFSAVSKWLAGALLLVGGFNAIGGVAQNSTQASPYLAPREAIRELLQPMKGIVAQSDRPRRFTYAFLYSAVMNRSVIPNTLFFDQHVAFDKDRAAIIGNSRLVGIGVGGDLITASQWSSLPGSDEEKLASIVQSANEKVDFLFVPGPGTQLPGHVYGNRFSAELYRRVVESGQWEQIAGPVTMDPFETAILLRNRRRAAEAR